MIRISQLTKNYVANNGATVPALGPLDIEIADGEFVCIVGPSGCGKSTLLRILANLDMPSDGTFEIQPVQGSAPILVFQGDSTFPWMTVHDNIAYGLHMHARTRDLPDKERDAITRRMMRAVGLERFAEAYPHELSGGMKQRVALARAWALDPSVLLMDEPFGALDEQTRLALHAELLRLWEATDDARTILFVTHSIDEALTLADRVLVMTTAPGQIKDEIRVSFARPRDPIALKRDPQYGELSYRIWSALKR